MSEMLDNTDELLDVEALETVTPLKNDLSLAGIVPEKEEVKTAIEELNLSVRTYESLKLAGINTIEELVKYSKKDLLRKKYFNEACLEEVVESLAKRGMKLDCEEEINKNNVDEIIAAIESETEAMKKEYEERERLLNILVEANKELDYTQTQLDEVTKKVAAEFAKYNKRRKKNS